MDARIAQATRIPTDRDAQPTTREDRVSLSFEPLQARRTCQPFADRSPWHERHERMFGREHDGWLELLKLLLDRVDINLGSRTSSQHHRWFTRDRRIAVV